MVCMQAVRFQERPRPRWSVLGMPSIPTATIWPKQQQLYCFLFHFAPALFSTSAFDKSGTKVVIWSLFFFSLIIPGERIFLIEEHHINHQSSHIKHITHNLCLDCLLCDLPALTGHFVHSDTMHSSEPIETAVYRNCPDPQNVWISTLNILTNNLQMVITKFLAHNI